MLSGHFYYLTSWLNSKAGLPMKLLARFPKWVASAFVPRAAAFLSALHKLLLRAKLPGRRFSRITLIRVFN